MSPLAHRARSLFLSLASAIVVTSALLLKPAAAQIINEPPIISGTPTPLLYVGEQYNFKPFAKDPERTKLRFTIANKPDWVSFDPGTGRLRGSAKEVGWWGNIEIKVSDGTNTAALPPFSITVLRKSNTAPTISGTPATSVAAGSAYSFQPSANDADGDALGFSIANKPSWATFSTSSGRLSGVPTVPATHSNVVISVSDGKATTSLPAFFITVDAPTNVAPTISGTPPSSVQVGSTYSFRPAASDADGDDLTFSIANKPAWATFSTLTGQLSGTPSLADVGTYAGMVISASDGSASASLSPFAIAVTQPAIRRVTLSWQPPTKNTDGSDLLDLAGYRILYGTDPAALTESIQVSSADTTTCVIENLSPGAYYFSVRAYNRAGAESESSAVVSRTLQ